MAEEKGAEAEASEDGSPELGGGAPLYDADRASQRAGARRMALGGVPVVLVPMGLASLWARCLFPAGGKPPGPLLFDWGPRWLHEAAAVEVGVLAGLLTFGVWALYMGYVGRFLPWDRRRRGYSFHRRGCLAAKELARDLPGYGDLLGDRGPVEDLWVAGGLVEAPGDDGPLCLHVLTLAMVAGTFAVTGWFLFGWSGVALAKLGFPLAVLLYLAGPRHGRWQPASVLGLALLAYGATVGAVLPPSVRWAPGGILEGLTAVLAGAALLRLRGAWHDAARMRVLARTPAGWFYLDPGRGAAEAVRPCAPGRPARAEEDADAFVVRVPLEGGGVAEVHLASLEEYASLQGRAPPEWALPPVPPPRPVDAPRRSLQAAVALAGSVTIGYLAAAGMAAVLGPIRLTDSWLAGEPGALRESCDRHLALFPWSPAGHTYAALGALTDGDFAAARRHAGPALEWSRREGTIGGLAARLEEDATRGFLDAALALEREVAELVASEHEVPLEAYRHFRRGLGLRRLHEDFPSGAHSIHRELVPYREFRLALERAGGEYPRAREHLALVMANATVAETSGEGVPEVDGVPRWSYDDALKVASEIPGDRGARVRGRVLFAGDHYLDALPLLLASSEAFDQARGVVALLARARLAEDPLEDCLRAAGALGALRENPEWEKWRLADLGAWVAAATGQLDRARAALDPAGVPGHEKAFRVAFANWLEATYGGEPGPARLAAMRAENAAAYLAHAPDGLTLPGWMPFHLRSAFRVFARGEVGDLPRLGGEELFQPYP